MDLVWKCGSGKKKYLDLTGSIPGPFLAYVTVPYPVPTVLWIQILDPKLI
jgi:hypothetical protein